MNHTALASTAIFVLLLAGATADARIYKTVDEDGNVVFTDVPPKDNQQSIELSQGNRYAPVTVPKAAPTVNDPADDEADAEDAGSSIGYERLAIASPVNDEPVRENAGNLTVDLTIRPPLNTDRGHHVEILMDGAPFAHGQSDGGTIELTNIDRGTHSLQAHILDASGNILVTSQPVTFHMLRVSVLNPARPRPRPGG
jgi:hypothetical protein